MKQEIKLYNKLVQFAIQKLDAHDQEHFLAKNAEYASNIWTEGKSIRT